jgi:hypothetical protein
MTPANRRDHTSLANRCHDSWSGDGSFGRDATGGNGYTVALDPTVAHGGKQSLRMSRNAAQSTSTSVDRAKIATAWKDVVDHLETTRPAYRSKGISDSAIDWAAQNAFSVAGRFKLSRRAEAH